MSDAALSTAQVKYDEAMAMGNGGQNALAMDPMTFQQVFEDKMTDCLSMAKDALVSCRRAGDSQGKVKALGVVVKAYLAMENSFDALMAAKDELAMIKRGKSDEVAMTAASDLLYDVYMARGEYKAALEVVEEILPLVKASGEKEKQAVTLNKLAELKISLRKAADAVGPAQEAKTIFEELGSKDGIMQADRMLSWAYVEKGSPDKAPNRQDALKALQELEQAALSQARSRWESAIEDLNKTYAFSQKDMKKVIDKALEEDKKGATEFFKEVGIEVGESAVAKTADGECLHFREIPQSHTYMSFRFGGLGYGPRFRYQHSCKATTGSARGPTTEDKQWYATGVVEIKECADDWERQLQFNPGILDCGLQLGAALGH